MIAAIRCSLFALLLAPAVALAQAEVAAPTPAPAAAELYFISPAPGAVVSAPVRVRFGLRGMGVAPAGIALPDTGHHHLLVDVETPPAAGQPIPADANHLHFGKGQTETELALSPGRHTLQLILGDHLHRPHQPPLLSEKIEITVE